MDDSAHLKKLSKGKNCAHGFSSIYLSDPLSSPYKDFSIVVIIFKIMTLSLSVANKNTLPYSDTENTAYDYLMEEYKQEMD